MTAHRLHATAARLSGLLLGLLAGAVGAGLAGASPTVTEAPDDGVVDVDLAAAGTPTGPTTTRLASLNVLGHGHTGPRGNKPRYADGRTRMAWQVEVLRAEGVDLVGFQELEAPQYAAFTRLTAGEYAMWPGGTGDAKVLRNSIAWRTDTWALVRTSRLDLPYFHGKPVPMPVVLLRHVVTGQQVYVMNFQNPASTRGNASTWRAQGRARTSALVNRLRTTTGLPVLWTGDFNDREKAFCDVVARTDLRAANGGAIVNGRCSPPRVMAVDWIFASAGTTFTDVSFDRRAKIARSTDHKLVLATATVPVTPGVAP